MKLLVYQTEFYFDGHGEGEEGSTVKFISENEHLLKINEEKFYDEDVLHAESDEDVLYHERNEEYLYAEDGYNCTAFGFSVTKISDEEAILIQGIIDAYDNIESVIKS